MRDEMDMGEIGRQRHWCGAGVSGFGYMRRGGLAWNGENGTSLGLGDLRSQVILTRGCGESEGSCWGKKVGKGGIWESRGERVRWLQQVAQM